MLSNLRDIPKISNIYGTKVLYIFLMEQNKTDGSLSFQIQNENQKTIGEIIFHWK